MDLTGCYTALWESREGARAAEAATAGNNQRLFRILQQVTGYRDGRENREDPRHPKLRLVLEETLRRWDQGEKTLIFCFRVPTARTLARFLLYQPLTSGVLSLPSGSRTAPSPRLM
jgi:hypothetical protein